MADLPKPQQKSEGRHTPITGYQARASATIGYTANAQAAPHIRSVSGATWFGPFQPLPPLAPPGAGGRRFDYPAGVNLNSIPRAGRSRLRFARARRRARRLRRHEAPAEG